MVCPWVAFADDFKIWSVFPDDSGIGLLQDDLNRIYSVSRSWNLCLNTEKCVVMHFGRGSPAEVFVDGRELSSVQSYRDLGVIVDSSLKFHNHVRLVAGKAGGLMSELLRSTLCRSEKFMMTLYTSHIRPIMDYCSCVWYTGYVGDTRLLERVQKRWTREVQGLREMNYADRLKRLDLFSVQGRFLRRDLIKMWQIMTGQTDHDLLGMFHFSRDLRTRGHSFKLDVPRHRTDVFSRSFSTRHIQKWNALPAMVVESSTLETFKRRLDAELGNDLFSFT